MGKVYLIGAGLGMAELITRKGFQVIEKADCIIYDRLIDPELLRAAKEGCEFIYVGKQNHHHSMRQEDINALLVKKAQEYEKVVRLKGGDVYVFGRGGEEGIYLKEHNISFEVIPGISSSIAGLCYAGIPITHRGISGGFYVLTAHDKRDELADLPFERLAKTDETCVFLMGLSKLKEIMDGLIKAGKPKDTKVAVIAHAALPEQKTVVGTIWDIAERAEKEKLTSPALIAVGDVVTLREKLNFYEELPLFGKSYLIPKVGDRDSLLTERLRESGAKAVEVKIGRIQLTPENMKDFVPEKYSWVILTSKNGIESFFMGLKKYEIDLRRLSSIKFAVTGKTTAKYLKDFGFHADQIPERYDSDSLFEGIQKELCQKDRICFGKVEGAGERISKRLKTICEVDELSLYRNEEIEMEESWKNGANHKYDAIIFTCSSAVKRLMHQIKQQDITRFLKEDGAILSIGEKTSETLRNVGVSEILQAKEATYEGLFELCMEFFK